MIEEEPIGKRPLERPRLRWEDCVQKDSYDERKGNQTKEGCRIQRRMTRVVFSGMVLKVETN